MPGSQETASATRSPAPAEVLAAHRGAGRFFHAAGVRSFVREQGTGPAVVCIHGMIGSSFLYRKVLDELAGHGLRGVAFDLPGLGLADRPASYDYSWTGLGRFCAAAVDELGIGRFHLVVHDIGGPVGFELAAATPHRILTLTMLNTTVDVTEFTSPWSMRPFRHRGAGEIWMRSLNRPAFRFLMRLQGIGDRSSVSAAELDTYLTLMKGPDRGRAFLQIMRSTERTPVKQARYRAAVGNVPYPVQAIWGADDPAMTLAVYGERRAPPLAWRRWSRCQASTSRRKTRRQPSHGRSLSKRCGPHPEPIGEEWFTPAPQVSKTTAVPLIPGPDNVTHTPARRRRNDPANHRPYRVRHSVLMH